MAQTQKSGGGTRKYGRNTRQGKFGGGRRSPAYSGLRKKAASSRKGNYPAARLIPNAKGETVIVKAYETK